MGKVIAFSNQKGGSGKSTLSANLSVLWSNSGYKVAVIDADAQKSLSYWLEARKSYYGEDDIGIIQLNFDIRNLIDEIKAIKRKYDFIIIDSPPSITFETMQGCKSF
jgi:ATPases involved in chromosome partitioning